MSNEFTPNQNETRQMLEAVSGPIKLEGYIHINHKIAAQQGYGAGFGMSGFTPYDQLVEEAMPIIVTEDAGASITEISTQAIRKPYALEVSGAQVMQRLRDNREHHFKTPLDLPSRTTWIEAAGIKNPIVTLPTSSSEYSRTHVLGLMVKELDPHTYLIDVYGYREVLATGMTNFHCPKFLIGNDHDCDDDALECWAFIDAFCKFIQTAQEGTSRINFRTRIGTGQSRRRYELKDITYMRPRQELGGTSTDGDNEIEWSHRWKVRGHWRKVMGVGRDRDGAYRISGMTWINEYIKGPEDKPYLNKKRILTNQTRLGVT